MPEVGSIFVKIGADSRGLQRGLQDAESAVRRTGAALSRLGSQITLGVTVPLVALATKGVQAWNVQAKAIAKVENAIASTGGAAQLTLQQLTEEASRLQKGTLFGDEEILNRVSAQLLTFTNIAKDQFLRTQRAALDLSAVLEQDLQTSAIQLGKALNDPVANLGALGRAGIQFSKSQKDVIKSLAETGRVAEAQRLILDELEKQYGGAAEAIAKVGSGPLVQLQNRFGDLTEEIGKNLMPVLSGTLIPVLGGLADALEGVDDATKQLGVRLALVAAALGPVVKGFGLLLAAITPVRVAIVALVAAGTLLVSKWREIKAEALGVAIQFRSIFPAFDGLIKGLIAIQSPAKTAADAIEGVGDAAEEAGRQAGAGAAGVDKFLGAMDSKAAAKLKAQLGDLEDQFTLDAAQTPGLREALSRMIELNEKIERTRELLGKVGEEQKTQLQGILNFYFRQQEQLLKVIRLEERRIQKIKELAREIEDIEPVPFVEPPPKKPSGAGPVEFIEGKDLELRGQQAAGKGTLDKTKKDAKQTTEAMRQLTNAAQSFRFGFSDAVHDAAQSSTELQTRVNALGEEIVVAVEKKPSRALVQLSRTLDATETTFEDFGQTAAGAVGRLATTTIFARKQVEQLDTQGRILNSFFRLLFSQAGRAVAGDVGAKVGASFAPDYNRRITPAPGGGSRVGGAIRPTIPSVSFAAPAQAATVVNVSQRLEVGEFVVEVDRHLRERYGTNLLP